jgi:glycosyltransferase involved in cell wall biosynthesis
MLTPAPDISIIVPVYNEEENLPPLYQELRASLEPLGRSFELLFVDDRSSDRSLAVLLGLRAVDPRVRVVRLRRNFGQTAALAAGFDQARGEVIVTLDGDLQNDPADIPKLLAEIERGADVVAGWRKRRHDGLVLRRLPSLAANRLIAWMTRTKIHDTGCTLKAFRRELVKNMRIYAEQHRFLPVLSQASGARVVEIVVHHRPRRFGRSKYGIARALRVLLDLLAIQLITTFAGRPLQYFGLFSLPFALFSFLVLLFGTVDFQRLVLVGEWFQIVSFSAFLFASLAIHFVLCGLLSELAVRASGYHRRSLSERILSRSR